MRRHLAYLRYVLLHKWYVFREGRKLGVPLLSLILHDWDKLLPDEFFPYAQTFYAPDGSRHFLNSIEFAYAWKLHQSRNKHHWQYWIRIDGTPLPKSDYMIWDRGHVQRIVIRNTGFIDWMELRDDPHARISMIPMPDKHRREMLADWRAASLAITGEDNTEDWYAAHAHNMILHPETRRWIEDELGVRVYEEELERLEL